MAEPSPSTLLEISQLSLYLDNGNSEQKLVDNINLSIRSGQSVAIVGESGAGKSLTAYAIPGLLPGNINATGEILFDEQSLLDLPEPKIRALRGAQIGMVFQEPQSALNPLHKVGDQVAEVLRLHNNVTKAEAYQETIQLFNQVELPNPETLLHRLPHELSGGQRQRVLIAMAIACKPKLLIADEPTTAIDATQQKTLMLLLQKLQRETGMAMLFISHDMELVRDYCQYIAVMANGRIVEQNQTEAIFNNPNHPVTRALINSAPTGSPLPLSPAAETVLAADKLQAHHKPTRKSLLSLFSNRQRKTTPAIEDISIHLKAGETLGLVGESGSGKTTLGLALLKLLQSDGDVSLLGNPVQHLSEPEFRLLRKNIQLVFQDPYNSLNPRMTIREILEEGLLLHTQLDKSERQQRLQQILIDTGFLSSPAEINQQAEAILCRYPHAFSGGQRQRIALARALILKPALVILDEPTSSLDRPLQQQLLNLLRSLQRKYQTAYLLISHDLAVVKTLSHRLAVMKDGHIIESGDSVDILDHPQQPYTRRLIAAAQHCLN